MYTRFPQLSKYKYMKKLIIGLGILMVAGMNLFAANTNNVTTSLNEPLFKNHEFSLNLGTAYVVDTHASTVSGAFASPYAFNINVGAQWYQTRYFGAEVNLPLYSTKGVSVSEISAGLLARLPMGHFAPYLGAGGVYRFAGDWAYIGKAGLEWRPSRFGLFAEAQYRNTDFQFEKGQVTLAGGIRLTF